MDPLTVLTAALALAQKALEFAMKIYDDTPLAIRQQGAADWGTFVHRIAAGILDLQKQIEALLPPIKSPQ